MHTCGSCDNSVTDRKMAKTRKCRQKNNLNKRNCLLKQKIDEKISKKIVPITLWVTIQT
jgi:hypothetical protein